MVLLWVDITYPQHGGPLCTWGQLSSQHKTAQGLTEAPFSATFDQKMIIIIPIVGNM